MNILITNRYGGKLVTCERHEPERSKLIIGQDDEAHPRVPTEQPCPNCEQERKLAELPGLVRKALLDAKFSHSRFREWCGAGCVYIYHRNPTSPSGVMLAVGCPASMFDPIYNALRAEGLIGSGASPLSPTEGL